MHTVNDERPHRPALDHVADVRPSVNAAALALAAWYETGEPRFAESALDAIDEAIDDLKQARRALTAELDAPEAAGHEALRAHYSNTSTAMGKKR